MMGAARWMSCCVVPAAAGTTALYENGNICTVQYDCMVQYLVPGTSRYWYHTILLRPRYCCRSTTTSKQAAAVERRDFRKTNLAITTIAT